LATTSAKFFCTTFRDFAPPASGAVKASGLREPPPTRVNNKLQRALGRVWVWGLHKATAILGRSSYNYGT